MENSSYALFIVVGTLLAIIIITFIVMRWQSIGEIEKTKDDVIVVKNKADFNAEFEAYNKSLMYGTDVLSCLNKAQNNNQKYVYNNYYGTDTENFGAEDRKEYFIDVEVTVNTPLHDNVRAYYKDKFGKYQRAIGLSGEAESNYSDKVFLASSNYFDDPMVDYYYFQKGVVYQDKRKYTNVMWPGTYSSATLYEILTDGLSSGGGVVGSGVIETNFKAGTYNLLTKDDDNLREFSNTPDEQKKTAMLAALISTVSLKSQKVENRERPSAFDGSDWSYCEWITSASDFKTRKFKCTGSEYNMVTGYITKLSFKELD